ncbi:hypothetical protein OS493_016706 [Desmophyllum pertusum]|uniref:beta-N-acetylhexosaminidase n=1 Tax=Desmophyllum pertusum TaxID=174260 RepID=A0A9W9Z0E4_9CNID|nr:hypothetical protein OS493_016706 [Desmophyllum pertusum]
MYKMNKFHFHLSDSEGWRLEIPGLDELTGVGARRCHDLLEGRCIMSQLGSGPFDTSTSGTGYYSTEDYREILRHATQRHIQVIPEFDFPRHSHAAIISMIARHDRMVTQRGKEREAKNFLLCDLKDKSQYSTPQGFPDDVINPCINSTYDFLEYLLSTLLHLHGDIQPLTFFHFGGDEVPDGVWVESPECHKMTHAFEGSIHFTKQVLMEHFIRNLIHITQKYGLDIGAWGDAFTSKDGAVINRDALSNKGCSRIFWGSKRR